MRPTVRPKQKSSRLRLSSPDQRLLSSAELRAFNRNAPLCHITHYTMPTCLWVVVLSQAIVTHAQPLAVNPLAVPKIDASLLTDLKKSRFAMPSSFCELSREDTLKLNSTTLRHTAMRSHGGPSCKYLPFREFNHSTIQYDLVYRFVPKAGSSTVSVIMENLWKQAWKDSTGGKMHEVPLHWLHDKQGFRKVRSCTDDSSLEAWRQRGSVVEFGVMRDPLARFVSGYYYTGENLAMDPLRKVKLSQLPTKLPKKDGGRERLLQFASTLPDGCTNVHLFP